jgi:hypothetical protein
VAIFENRAALELLQNLRIFWNVEAGVTRDGAPGVVHRNDGHGQQAKRIEQLQDTLSRRNQRLEQQSRQIKQLKGRPSKNESANQLRQLLAEKDRELEELRAAGPGRPASREHVPIFFVVGRQRSGTNWLMRTLNSHPEILCRGEGRFFGQSVRRDHLKGMHTSEHIRFKLQPSSLYNALAADEHLRLWIERSVWSRDDDPEEHLRKLTRQAVRYFLTEKLSRTNKRMVGDKTPLASKEIVKEISIICPEAKVIHIIRDGRDQSISMLHFIWNRATDVGGIHELTPEELDKRDRYRKDPEAFLASGESIFTEERLRDAAEAWVARVGAARQDGPALLGDRYTEVHYEELLVSPHQDFGRLFSFLGASSDDETVSSCVAKTSFEQRSGGRKQGEEDSHSGVRKGVAGDWKGVFTERDREIFKEVAGEMLVELGYEKDLSW